MVSKIVAAAVLGACIGGSSFMARAGSPSSDELMELAKSYVDAQFSFDQGTLRRVVAPKFVEISPKGEVDEINAVLSFYDQKKKTAAPPYFIENQVVRVTSNFAVVTQTVTIGTPPRSMSLSQALTAVRTGNKWKLTSSQSTPVPPRKP